MTSVVDTCACGAPKQPLTKREIALHNKLRGHKILLCPCGHEVRAPETAKDVREVGTIKGKLAHRACAAVHERAVEDAAARDRAMVRIGKLRGSRRPRAGSKRALELEAVVVAVEAYGERTTNPIEKLRASFARLVADRGGVAVDKMIDVACRKARRQTMKQIRAERAGIK